MKFLICFFILISADSFASLKGINPDKILVPLHFIFRHPQFDFSSNQVRVMGPEYKIVNESGGMVEYEDKYAFRFQRPLDSYAFWRLLASSVYTIQAGNGASAGTAFLIGKNYILTNRHLTLERKAGKNLSCGRLSIISHYYKNGRRDASDHFFEGYSKINCKNVVYCDEDDFCVVEMESFQGKMLSDYAKPLRLKENISFGTHEALWAIGNCGGNGIQVSSGEYFKPYLFYGDHFYHYVPTCSGSSGSPLFNQRGELIGLNFSHIGTEFGDSSLKNLGITSTFILGQLTKNLSPELLKELQLSKEAKIPSTSEVVHWKEVKQKIDEKYSYTFPTFIGALKHFLKQVSLTNWSPFTIDGDIQIDPTHLTASEKIITELQSTHFSQFKSLIMGLALSEQILLKQEWLEKHDSFALWAKLLVHRQSVPHFLTKATSECLSSDKNCIKEKYIDAFISYFPQLDSYRNSLTATEKLEFKNFIIMNCKVRL